MNTPLDCKIGDRVAYSAAFLRNTGQMVGEAPRMRGTIVAILDDPGFPVQRAVVEWDGYLENMRVLTCNLAKPGPNIRYCNC